MREKIIHMLGGVTFRESVRDYCEGSVDMVTQIYEKAKEFNGMDADTWCNSMWQYLGTTMDSAHDELERANKRL